MPSRRTALLLAGLLIALGGCGRHYWSRPNATLEDFNRDSAGCAKKANVAYGIFDEDTYRACLKDLGWVRAQQFEPVPQNWYRGIE